MAAIFTTSAGGTITYADTGDMATAGKWLCGEDDAELVEAHRYGYDYPSAAGVDGCGTTVYGFRGQRIALRATYINTTVAAVLAAVEADMKALALGPSSLALHSTTFQGCVLDGPASGIKGKIRWTGISNAYYAIVSIVVERKRLA